MTTKTAVNEVRTYHKLQDTLAKINVLREEMNDHLYKHPAERPQASDPVALAAIVRPFLAGLDHEEFYVICLDTRNRVVSVNMLYRGTINESPVRVAEVFRQAIMVNAPTIAIAHNHPSGDPKPSPQDLSLTRSIVQAGKLLDIDVVDHIVIGGDNDFISMRERGLVSGFGEVR